MPLLFIKYLRKYSVWIETLRTYILYYTLSFLEKAPCIHMSMDTWSLMLFRSGFEYWLILRPSFLPQKVKTMRTVWRGGVDIIRKRNEESSTMPGV